MSLEVKKIIKNNFSDFGIPLDDLQVNRFNDYLNLLVEWNQKINLTAITEPKEIVVKHFLDSAALFKYVQLEKGSSVIDVGTGAGFPGVVLKILRPDIKMTLLDSLKKRLSFLEHLLLKLNLDSKIIHCRAEDGAKNKDLREKFDLVTSRAVAKMNVLCEYCIPYVKLGGIFCPLKGKNFEDELTCAENSIETLGGILESENEFSLPGENERTIIVVRKKRSTQSIYPRTSKKILNNPL